MNNQDSSPRNPSIKPPTLSCPNLFSLYVDLTSYDRATRQSLKVTVSGAQRSDNLVIPWQSTKLFAAGGNCVTAIVRLLPLSVCLLCAMVSAWIGCVWVCSCKKSTLSIETIVNSQKWGHALFLSVRGHVLTFFLSRMEPFPRTMILQPVSCSNCLAVIPRGPNIRPTKLNWKQKNTSN